MSNWKNGWKKEWKKQLRNNQRQAMKELERRGWERDGKKWRSDPFVLDRKIIRDNSNQNARVIPLWHLERVDEHPGQAWFSDSTVPELFTIVDAELTAWE